MTKELKEKLSWRLPQLPSGEEVAALVEQKVLTTDEAREIVLKKDNKVEDDIKDLKEQVEFLKGVIQTMANNGNVNNYVTTYPTFRYTPTTPIKYYYTITN